MGVWWRQKAKGASGCDLDSWKAAFRAGAPTALFALEQAEAWLLERDLLEKGRSLPSKHAWSRLDARLQGGGG